MNSKTSSKSSAKKKSGHEHGISSYYGEWVFGPHAQSEYLSEKAQAAIAKAASHGEAVGREMATEIAEGMKNWALDLGATHYTHWFQPLRGTTAEKHDSFFEPSGVDQGVEEFSGKALVQQEPDASSFPNGGIRNTFEARGYTAWDPSSPAFVLLKGGTKTLCIPTIFVSYTGEALDYKAPLLKTLSFVRSAATQVCQYFDENVSDVNVSLGVEQEYFLVKEELFKLRPDLQLAGRTLVGHLAAKGQQLEDHYFGSIPEKVQAFMHDFEYRAHKLGIPLRTRHNEVAPAQFECAPQYEDLNLAVDHNALLMDVMESTAHKHGFRVLLHEKPYAGINGSGKHNNWSLITNTGVNLLSPGSSPLENLQFLTFFINTIKAVHDHADLMRASIATAGNDHRLGANEAPPAIMSVFVGQALEEVLDDFETSKGSSAGKVSGSIQVPSIPEILLDNTDRNRTSPFAFTGNKFEFRAVGSSDNCASPMVVLNTVVGNQLLEFKSRVDALIGAGKAKEEALKTVLREDLASSRRILFGGNGYSEEWVEEALRRGLNNIRHSADALEAYMRPSSVELFVKNGIFSERELEARTEIRYETFNLRLQIEGRVLNELVQNFVIPCAMEYQKQLADSVQTLLSIGQSKESLHTHLQLIERLSQEINAAFRLNNEMTEARAKWNKEEDAHQRALGYNREVKPFFESLRLHCDAIEQLVPDDLWTLPKYRELINLD